MHSGSWTCTSKVDSGFRFTLFLWLQCVLMCCMRPFWQAKRLHEFISLQLSLRQNQTPAKSVNGFTLQKIASPVNIDRELFVAMMHVTEASSLTMQVGSYTPDVCTDLPTRHNCQGAQGWWRPHDSLWHQLHLQLALQRDLEPILSQQQGGPGCQDDSRPCRPMPGHVSRPHRPLC